MVDHETGILEDLERNITEGDVNEAQGGFQVSFWYLTIKGRVSNGPCLF